MSLSWPEHLPTIDEWEALAEEDDRRLEIGMRLGFWLDEQLPTSGSFSRAVRRQGGCQTSPSFPPPSTS